MAAMKGYCVKCKGMRTMDSVRTHSTGRKGVIRLSGRCPKCGTKMSRFAKK